MGSPHPLQPRLPIIAAVPDIGRAAVGSPAQLISKMECYSEGVPHRPTRCFVTTDGKRPSQSSRLEVRVAGKPAQRFEP